MITSVSNLHITAGLSSLSRCCDWLRLQEEVTPSPQEAAVPSDVIWLVPTFPSAVSKLMTRFHPSVVGKPKLSLCDSVQRLVSKLLHPVKDRGAPRCFLLILPLTMEVKLQALLFLSPHKHHLHICCPASCFYFILFSRFPSILCLVVPDLHLCQLLPLSVERHNFFWQHIKSSHGFQVQMLQESLWARRIHQSVSRHDWYETFN